MIVYSNLFLSSLVNSIKDGISWTVDLLFSNFGDEIFCKRISGIELLLWIGHSIFLSFSFFFVNVDKIWTINFCYRRWYFPILISTIKESCFCVGMLLDEINGYRYVGWRCILEDYFSFKSWNSGVAGKWGWITTLLLSN